MYDFGATRTANDAFWSCLRDALRPLGVETPETLTRDAELPELWRSPGLLFAQTCGYPYWMGLRTRVDVLAAPIYEFEGCEGATHCSFLVVRRDDPRDSLVAFRDARAAVNAPDSNSGMNLFRAAIAPLADRRPFFHAIVMTGAHALSLKAVADGAADIAAIDCVTFALLQREGARETTKVRVLARTPSTPTLPYVSSVCLPANVRSALRNALVANSVQPRLGLAGVAPLPANAYARIAELEAQAVALGYPELA